MNPVRLKTFTASGEPGVTEIQHEVNKFLDETIDVVDTQTCMCAVGDEGDLYQSIMVSIWFRRID